MKKRINDLVGEIVKHKKFGRCEVLKIVNDDQGKIVCKVIETGEIKTLVFCKQFFDEVSKFETKEITIKVAKKQIHKEVDYKKYRDHPLIKEIDRKESGYLFESRRIDDEDNDDEEDYEE